MADVWELGVERVSTFRDFGPRQVLVGAAPREAVVAYPKNDLLLVHDASTHLLVRVFRSLRAEKRHRHEILVPVQIPDRENTHTHTERERERERRELS